jgi:hypothetical protein
MNNFSQFEPNNADREPAISWHDPAFVQAREKERKARLRKKPEDFWVIRFPLLEGLPRSAYAPTSREIHKLACQRANQWANEYGNRPEETLARRNRRLDGRSAGCGANDNNRRRTYAVPVLISKNSEDSWWISPAVAGKVDAWQLAQAKALCELGLTKKAQRQLACGLLWSVVACPDGHRYKIAYECGLRYCRRCGKKAAAQLFAKHIDRIKRVAARLVPCWPPHPGHKPKQVVAKMDFTLRNTGKMPDAQRHRELTIAIKNFRRGIEKEFGLKPGDYGLAVHHEIGGSNTNAHAHGVYFGPWLPNKKKELSEIWRRATPDSSFIISIKYAKSVASALSHATKYPAKFLSSSSPERLAQLEKSFHRVRRFRLLGAFEKRLLPPEEKLEEQKKGDHGSSRTCPRCGQPLSEPNGWVFSEGVQNLEELDQVRQQVARARVFGDAESP